MTIRIEIPPGPAVEALRAVADQIESGGLNLTGLVVDHWGSLGRGQVVVKYEARAGYQLTEQGAVVPID